jgi:hypothetical protein
MYNNIMDNCDTTFKGLHCWYVAMFEKVGWMILARDCGHFDKITSYKNGLTRLMEALDRKKSSLEDNDKKKDIVIMQATLNKLITSVNLFFPEVSSDDGMTGGARKKTSKKTSKKKSKKQ